MHRKTIIKSKNLDDVLIGQGEPIFTIAEIGLNHNGDVELGKKLIDAAFDAGCSSVKFQNFETDDVYIQGAKAGKYKLLGKEIPIYDLHTSLEIEYEFLLEMKTYAESKGLLFFSAPMGKNSLENLLKLDCDLIKVSSYEISNLPWIKKVAGIKKPIILSCGGAKLEEVDRAMNEIFKHHDQVALMHCVIKYPADICDANLKIMHTLRSAFEVPVGFSNNGFKNDKGKIDYNEIPYNAAGLGMDLYEIHITLDRGMDGVDQGFSTEPSELKEMVNIINVTREKFNSNDNLIINKDIAGSSRKITLNCEKYVREFAYKSIYTTKNVKKGEKLDINNIKCLRPGEYLRGLDPLHFEEIVEYFYAKQDIDAFEPINWKNIINY